ncbi:hypothetical protein OGAPHI_002038 [Ogataea philodendri]|uniref:ATPase n=1 Tax=Ogataea philodendri TaxID=1378263 RepID=A0A9P8T7A9_9ASCO|nr:uncharacterized protein OGAPHI_002038 [Ogataea philodendri]KAH3668284.1 hypothetical protein OGAPHI_002038 [Ogataea philodendri]
MFHVLINSKTGNRCFHHTTRAFTAGSGLVMTDPYQIYRAAVASGTLQADVHQHRAALEFQKLYFRLRDYTPNDKELQINNLVRQLEERYTEKNTSLLYRAIGYRQFWGGKIPANERKDLVEVLTDEEEIYKISAPQGLLVNGEVGCGKSMLLNTFAESLPVKGKLRVHYNNFILWVYSEIHNIYERRKRQDQSNHSFLWLENEFLLLEVASKMVRNHHVLMLDEFMLPDLASAKIVKILFTYFFKLGGVLVATSNRLPEELYSTDFNKTQFHGFERILKMRCQVFDMNSDCDYRMLMADQKVDPYLVVKKDPQQQRVWEALIQGLMPQETQSTTFVSYGREIRVPKHHNGVAYFDFEQLCGDSYYGPGEYISLASRFHTLVVDNIPVLTTRRRSEARRFITLLDSLYEARCNVVLRMEVEPSGLFFPDMLQKEDTRSNNQQILEEEMFARTQLYLSNPYRPNVQSYEEGKNEFTQTTVETNFKDVGRFTGEDEMFAYKRAVSRIYEMTYGNQWRKNEWMGAQMLRPWEQRRDSEISEVMEQVYSAPPAQPAQPVQPESTAPVFNPHHFWSMGRWRNKSKWIKDEIAKRWIAEWK